MAIVDPSAVVLIEPVVAGDADGNPLTARYVEP